MMVTSVAIVGSCVSRDPFDINPAGRPKILLYFARSSFACALSTEPFPLPLSRLDKDNIMISDWQKRMVTQDISRALPAALKQLPIGTTIVVDFVDERFKLLKYQGHLATYSADLSRTNCHNIIPGIELVSIDDQDRRSQWEKGFRSFISIAKERNMKVIINNCLYAHFDSEGNRTGKTEAIIKFNEYLVRMYNFAAAMNASLLFEDGYEFVAAAQHRWGVQPFHYTNDVYLDFNRRLDKYIS